MQQVISELHGLRRRSRFMLVTQRLALLVACTLGALIAMIAVDFALRLPAGVRLVLLLAGLGGLATRS